MRKLGRNDPCHCGSGKKYKHCCLGKEPRVVAAPPPAYADAAPPLLAGPSGAGFRPDAYDDDRFPRELEAEWSDLTADTPSDRAYDLALQGWDVRGAARIELAKQALEESPDCVEAYNLLGSEAPTPEKAIAFYEQALAVADRVLGPDWWENNPRRDWLEPPAAESALDARVNLGRALMRSGRFDEAIAQFRSVLAFDPEDEDGNRYFLLDALLATDRDDEALALIDEYPETPSSRWPYARALLKFRRDGDTLWARRALVDALAFNATVTPYLLDRMPPPDASPLSDLLDGDSDAVDATRNLDDDWRRTPGAIEWLAAIFDAGPDSRPSSVPRGDGPILCRTPSDAIGYILCPRCERKTKPRKREVVVLVEPDELAATRLACRHCENCDILSILTPDLDKGVASVMRSRGLDIARCDSVPLGIVDPTVAEARLAEASWLEDHLLRWRDEISVLSEIERLLAGRDVDDDGLFAEPDPAGVIDVPFSVSSR